MPKLVGPAGIQPPQSVVRAGCQQVSVPAERNLLRRMVLDDWNKGTAATVMGSNQIIQEPTLVSRQVCEQLLIMIPNQCNRDELVSKSLRQAGSLADRRLLSRVPVPSRL